MKRQLTLIVLIITTFCGAYAQKKTTTVTTNAVEERSSYLGIATGINNISGIGGITFETPFSDNFSAKVGAGFGGWGVKLGVAAKYYRQYAKSWSFGAGYSTASGLDKLPLEQKKAFSSNTTETIEINLKRAHMIDLVAGKSWGGKVRFNLELGYAVRVAGGTFAPSNKTDVLAETTVQALNLLSPNGLILGLGLTFKL